jgi:putative IMPACT (imprinted ancient) family translation regulator
VRLDYGDEQTARRVLTRLGIEVLSAEYADRAVLHVLATEDESAAIVEEVSASTSGRAKFEPPTDAV